MDEQDKFEAMDQARYETHTYRPPSTLKIDEDIKSRFREAGYYLKWVNRKNVRKKMHPSEGFTFVTPDEFDATELLMLGDTEGQGDSAAITNGDLILMKTRVENAEARRAYYRNKTKSQADAIEQRLRENALDHGGTKSVVRTGKTAHFAKNF